jgi:hypothetical protein
MYLCHVSGRCNFNQIQDQIRADRNQISLKLNLLRQSEYHTCKTNLLTYASLTLFI